MNIKSFLYCSIISIIFFTSCSEAVDEASTPYSIAKENNVGLLNGNNAIISDAEVGFLTNSTSISKDNYIEFSFTLTDKDIANDSANVKLKISTDLLNKTINIEDTYKDNYESYFLIEEYLSSYGGYLNYENAIGNILVSSGSNDGLYTLTISNLIEGKHSISCFVAFYDGE